MVMTPARPSIEEAPESGAIFLPWQQEIQFDPTLTDEQLGRAIFHQSINFSMLHMDILGPRPVKVADIMLDDAPPIVGQEPRYRSHSLFFQGLAGSDAVTWELHKSTTGERPHVVSVVHLEIGKHGSFAGWYGDYDEYGLRFSTSLGENYAESEQARYHLMQWGQIQRVLRDPQTVAQIEAIKRQKIMLEDELGMAAVRNIVARSMNGNVPGETAQELTDAQVAFRATGFITAGFRENPGRITQPVNMQVKAHRERQQQLGQFPLFEVY